MKLLDDFDAYSNLLLSVKTHKSERPLEPIEVAKLIARLQKENGESLEEVGKRIGIKTDQIKSFLKLLLLPKQVHYALGWGDTNAARVSFTTGAIISELEDYAEKEYLVKLALNNSLRKEETRRIIQLKKQSPAKEIAACVQEVLKLRPVIEKGYLIINMVSDQTLERLNELSANQHTLVGNTIVQLANKMLKSGKAENATVRNNSVFITVDEEGYESILGIQSDNKILFKDLTEFLLNGGLKSEA